MGSGGLAPLGCLPLWGREGVTLAISIPAKKNSKGFPLKINYSVMIRDFYSQSSMYDDCRRPRRVAPAADQ
jgi:hypothetical protein